MTTQFISKVERPAIVKPSHYDDSVGPGSYKQPETIRRSLPGFAPFATTSKRTSIINESDLDKPAPGLYNTAESLVKKSNSSVAAFKSKSTRFETKKPLPSEETTEGFLYTLKSDFDIITSKRAASRPNKKAAASTILEIIKSSSGEPVVPSIPTKGQYLIKHSLYTIMVID
jgi:hypothetical protein